VEADMNAIEMLQNVEFVVDDQGNKKAVLLDYEMWAQLLVILEDLEDAAEIGRLREAGEEAIPWEQAKAQLRAEDLDV